MTTETATTKPATPDCKGPHRRFIAEALMLRAQHNYAEALRHAAEYGVSGEPPPPPWDAISDRYVRLLNQWSSEIPGSAHDALAYVDFVAAIVGNAVLSRFERECTIVSQDQDMAHALDLLASVHTWLNHEAISDAIREERAKNSPEQQAKAAIVARVIAAIGEARVEGDAA